MNVSYEEIDKKVIVTDEKGNKRVISNRSNLDTLLKLENDIELLEEELAENKQILKEKKHILKIVELLSIPTIMILGGTIGWEVIYYLITSTINSFSFLIFIIAGLCLQMNHHICIKLEKKIKSCNLKNNLLKNNIRRLNQNYKKLIETNKARETNNLEETKKYHKIPKSNRLTYVNFLLYLRTQMENCKKNNLSYGEIYETIRNKYPHLDSEDIYTCLDDFKLKLKK